MIIEKQTSIESGKAVVILHIEGLIKLGESSAYFVAACKKFSGHDVVLNFARVDYIDSTGIGELVGSCVALARAGENLVLVNVPERITKLLKIAHATDDLRVLEGDHAIPYRATTDAAPPISDYPEDELQQTPPDFGPTLLITVREDMPLESSLAERSEHLRRIIIHGKVQGVGYRFFATRVARRMGLKGWVENMADGTVFACVEGSRVVIDEWLEVLREGPRYSIVTKIEQELLEFTGQLKGFDVKF